jgi:hypothetical protein
MQAYVYACIHTFVCMQHACILIISYHNLVLLLEYQRSCPILSDHVYPILSPFD